MAKPTGAERARRMVALLRKLRHEGEMRLSPLAETLGISVEELADDLTTLSMCGVAPYDPLALVPVMVVGDTLEVFGELPAVSGPVRLSGAEAAALAAALQAAGFDADDALSSRLLGAVADSFSAAHIEKVVRASIQGHDTAVYETLAAAVEDHEAVEIRHTGAESSTPTDRIIEPSGLFAERGAWYVSGWCRLAGDARTFRLDRIESARPIGEHFEPRHDRPVEALDTDELPMATLRFSPETPYVEREWPGSRLIDVAEDGTASVEVPYAGSSWLPRRVVARLGGVELVAPPELRARVAELAGEIVRSLPA